MPTPWPYTCHVNQAFSGDQVLCTPPALLQRIEDNAADSVEDSQSMEVDADSMEVDADSMEVDADSMEVDAALYIDAR